MDIPPSRKYSRVVHLIQLSHLELCRQSLRMAHGNIAWNASAQPDHAKCDALRRATASEQGLLYTTGMYTTGLYTTRIVLHHKDCYALQGLLYATRIVVHYKTMHCKDRCTLLSNDYVRQTHLNQTTIALNPTSIFQSISLLPYTGLLGTLLTLTAHHLLLNFPVFQSFHLLKMQTSSVTFCALY